MTCSLEIRSTLELEQVAQILSEVLFGQISLGGREDFIFDEVPAVYSRAPIFGERITLQGIEESGCYFLEARGGSGWPDVALDSKMPRKAVDVSACLAQLLGAVDGVSVTGCSGSILTCGLRFHSKLNLGQLGAIISERVLGGLEMVAVDSPIQGTCPAVRSKKALLGLWFVLTQAKDEHSFSLESEPATPNPRIVEARKLGSIVHISGIVAGLLSEVDDLRVEG